MIQSTVLRDLLKSNKNTIDLDFEAYKRLERSQSPLKSKNQSILRNCSITSAKTIKKPAVSNNGFVSIKKTVSFAKNMVVFNYQC